MITSCKIRLRGGETHPCADLPEVGEALGDIWEGVVVRHVPVEDIELVHLHQVEVVPYDGLGDVVTRRVDQDSAVGEPRRVPNSRPLDQVLGKAWYK